jgi:hypothetical protein
MGLRSKIRAVAQKVVPSALQGSATGGTVAKLMAVSTSTLTDPKSLVLGASPGKVTQAMPSAIRRIVPAVAGAVGTYYGGTVGGAAAGALGGRLAGQSASQGAITGLAAGQLLETGQTAYSAFTEAGGGWTGVSAALPTLFGAVSAAAAPPGGGAPGSSMPGGPGRLMTAGMFPNGLSPFAAGGAQFQQAALPMVGPIIGGAARMLGSLAVTAGGRILGAFTAGGAFLRAKRIMSGVKVLGIGAASAALGISATEIAQIVLQEAQKKRRSKGISPAAMRTATRVTRKIIRYHRDLAQLCRPAGFVARRSPVHK